MFDVKVTTRAGADELPSDVHTHEITEKGRRFLMHTVSSFKLHIYAGERRNPTPLTEAQISSLHDYLRRAGENAVDILDDETEGGATTIAHTLTLTLDERAFLAASLHAYRETRTNGAHTPLYAPDGIFDSTQQAKQMAVGLLADLDTPLYNTDDLDPNLNPDYYYSPNND